MATIYLGRPVFYRRGESGMSAVVGIENHMARIARYEITAPSIGASSVSLRFVGFSGGEGTRPSRLRCYIGTNANSHADAGSGSPYTCILTRSGSAYTGSADIVLLPSTRYYVWVFPDDFSTYGWMFWSIGAQDGTMETSGAAASDLSAGNGTLGSRHTLSLHRYSTAATHELTASCGSASTTIATGVQADSYAWTPPINWAAQNTTGTSVQVTVTCKTLIGGSVVGADSVTITMDIPDSVKPTCRMTLTDPSGLLGELGSYVQGKSKIKVEASGSGIYGSSIRAYEISVGEIKSNRASATFELPDSGSVYVIARVQDSRGRWGDTDTYITVTPYRVPKAEILNIYRCDADGRENPQGDHATVVFNATVDPLVHTSARYAIKYRVRGGTYWSTLQLTGYNGVQQITGGTAIIPVDPGLSYECCVQAADRWPPARMSPYRTCPVAFALLQIDKDRNAFGIGQQAGPDDTISVGLQVLLNGPLAVAGLIARAVIRAGEDADHYTDPGVYSTIDNNNASRIKNLPSGYGGLLWVYNAFGGTITSGPWVYITQVYRPAASFEPTYRRLIESDGAGKWRAGQWRAETSAVSAAILDNV